MPSVVAGKSAVQNRLLQCGERFLDLGRPHVMGILNVTPDSFSDGGCLHSGRRLDLGKILFRAEQMLSQGATIIDVGGESTRPGAAVVGVQEEMDRVLPVVESIHERLDVVISVDTSSPKLMQVAAHAGAGMLNDVRALEREGALSAAKNTGLPICLMHMQGEPASMQAKPQYRNVIDDVSAYLRSRVSACEVGGISREKLLLDPGFGFGKSAAHNLILLNRLAELLVLGCPLLVGLSRKSLIGAVLDRAVDDRLAGSLSLAVLAVDRGASIVRVHDVKETMDAVRLARAVIEASDSFLG